MSLRPDRDMSLGRWLLVACVSSVKNHNVSGPHLFPSFTNGPDLLDNGHRAHGQKEIMHAYGPKSTPIAQGLVEDINAMHAYGRSSAPIAQGLVYDINAPHAFGLRDSKPNA